MNDYLIEETGFKTVECNDCNRFMEINQDAKGGVCSYCTTKRTLALLSEDEKNRLFGLTGNKARGPKKPRGWRWMAEFVDSDGNVFYKGKEMAELKGTRPITDLEALKLERKAKKATNKRKEKRKLLNRAKKQKAAKRAKKLSVKEAIAKQKEFLNGDIKKGDD